jgi:hypothetical protein
MDVKVMTEMEKRALAKISTVIYGEELTLIMLPELKDYLNGAGKKDDLADLKIADGVSS